MVKAIPMEDWLRGCVYHDGRHGEVTLPTDKVLKIADYIQRTRRSLSDGMIDLKVEPIVDTPQTDCETRYCEDCKHYDDVNGHCFFIGRCTYEPKGAQTDCGWK